MAAVEQPVDRRLSPQAIDAEQSLLGSILIDPSAIIKISDYLKPSDFYRASHGHIYEAILRLHTQREPIDLVTLGDDLVRHRLLDAAGGHAALAALMDAVPTAVHVEHYARIVERTAVLRNIISAAGRIASVGYEEINDTEAAIDRAEAILREATQRSGSTNFESLAALMGATFDRLEELHNHRGQLLGVPTGLAYLDALLGGMQPSDLIILAARPSVGKTSLALNVAHHAAVREGKQTAIFSLEMSKEQLAVRLISSETGIDSRSLQTGWITEMEWGKVAETSNTLAEAPLWIDDSPALSVNELRTKARRLDFDHHLDLVIVDYLQLMHASQQENRVQEVSEISRGLKALARELRIPVLALSQLSRGVEQRGSTEPRLSDLRESGSIEQDADVVIFLFRTQEDINDSGVDMVRAKVAKHRNGPTGEITLGFQRATTRFRTVERSKG